MDAAQLPELTKRQEEILSLIVRAYTQNPEAVSSKYLVENYGLGVSSATVRNEMAALEDLGYIVAPHKSAGRVPTDQGYRYVVQRLMKDADLPQSEQKHIEEKFRTSPMSTETWMRLAATVLARSTRSASLVTPPVAETSRFKHVELVSIQGRLVLMVLVLHGGMVQQRMLNLAEPLPQDKLTEAARRINALCVDLYAHQLRLKALNLPLFEREVVELAVEVMEKSDGSQVRLIYREGLSDIIGNFQDGEGAQQAIRVFEERAFLNMILSDFLDPASENIRVVVAGDGVEELSQVSLVLSRYGVPGQMSGAVGVLGPTHINYGRAISSVRYVAGLMTTMFSEMYDDDAGSTDEEG